MSKSWLAPVTWIFDNRIWNRHVWACLFATQSVTGWCTGGVFVYRIKTWHTVSQRTSSWSTSCKFAYRIETWHTISSWLERSGDQRKVRKVTSYQWRFQTRRLGGSQIGGRQECVHLLKYQTLSATKQVIFCRSKRCYFCWSNYAIFQVITTVWKRSISLIQKTFETNSGPRFSEVTQMSYIYKMYLKYMKACCAQAFVTVLASPSEISEEQCLKRFPDLVRNRTVLHRPGSGNSCPTIGLKWKAKWRSCFQAKLVHLHVH